MLMTDTARLLLFPAMMAFAASSDLFTMTISNRVSLILVGGFFALAFWSGMSPNDVLSHVGAAFSVLAVTFVFFARGWIGGELAGRRVLCLAAGVLTFIASWTVIPGPAIWLVAIGVGGAELSPVFLVASLIVGGLVWRAGGGPRPYSMALTLIAVVIFAVPIARYPSDAPISIRRLVVGLEDTHARITRGVAIDGREQVSLMINEEDHLRMQALRPGLQLKQAWIALDAVDTDLESRLAGLK